MKKLFAVLLALLLALSMVSALADGETEEPQQPQAGYVENDGTFQIAKTYNITNADTTFPGETINFTVTGEPTVTVADVVVDTTGEALVTFDLPEYTNVGIYTYTVEETAGQTAGVTYDPKEYTLTVTVANGVTDGEYICYPALKDAEGKKLSESDGFVNTYSAGSLSVTKKVTGNMGDKNKYFEFKVTLTGEEGKNYPESFAVTGGSKGENPKTIALGKETTFYLKHGETITIANLPYGVEYAVTETPVDGYTTTSTGDSGTISAATQTAAFTNDNDNGSIDTGITTDSMPYIVLMGIVVLAGVAMIAKRRAANND